MSKILILCKKCNAKNRVDSDLKDKVIRCGKCGEPLSIELSDSLSPIISKLRDVAGKVKIEFEDYTHYKVCSITLDLVEDTVHIKWKVESNVDELWRLKQRWPIEFYFTLRMLTEIYLNAPDLLRAFAISFFERFLNFAPEDEGDNFRDLCLLSIRANRKQLKTLQSKVESEDFLKITGPRRLAALEELQNYVRENLSVRQNYKGTLVNKASLIYKAVKPFDLLGEEEVEEILEKVPVEKIAEDKKVTAMKIIEDNIEKIKNLDMPYIRIFAKKYGLGNEERRRSLKELLESKNIKLPDKVIYRLIQKELDEIEYERFEKRIKVDESFSLNHYIRRYLELFPDPDEYAGSFYKFLVNEKVIIEDVSMNVDRLKDLILKVKKSIELEQFERKLMDEVEAEPVSAVSRVADEQAKQIQIDPESESYKFFLQTLLPGKTGGISSVIRLYIDNFMDNNNNRAMLLHFLEKEGIEIDIEKVDINEEIKKIQYEDIPESIEEEIETFDTYSSQELVDNLANFDFKKTLHLLRYLFERMGFNARIIDKKENDSGVIFLDNKEDEKLVVNYVHTDEALTPVMLEEINDLVEQYHADYGICVSRGSFNDEAIQYALEKDIELIDKSKIRRLVSDVF